MKKLLTFFFVSALCFSACEKRYDNETENKSIRHVSEELYFGKYSKELLVYDASGENSAWIRIGTDDPNYFELLTTDNITLIPIRNNQSPKDAVDQFYKENRLDNNYEQEEVAEDSNEEDTSGVHVYSMILTKNLKENVRNVILFNNTPSPAKSGWIYTLDYGYAPTSGPNAYCQKATFIGQNNLHVGYYQLDYIRQSTQSNYDIIPDWLQIRTGDERSYERSDCFVMLSQRKYKSTSNPSVVVIFEH